MYKKLKKTLFFMLLLLNLLSFCGFAKDLKGNTSGNLNYGGLMVQNGSWIYYSNQDDGGKLYKINSAMNKKVKLNNSESKYINSYKNWIYFVENGNSICKINIDGKNKKKLITTSDIITWMGVVNDKIYYSDSDTKVGEHPGLDANTMNYATLNQTNLDGRNKKILANDVCGGMGERNQFSFININNGWIYYSKLLGPETSPSSKSSSLDSDGIHKIKITGKDDKEIFSNQVCDINVIEDWIYFVNVSQDRKLYKISLDGKKKIKILDDSVSDVNVMNGWIYYINLSDNKNVYKVKLDGTQKTKIKNINPAQTINVSESSIYSSDAFYVNTINKIGLQGEDKKAIVNDEVSQISASGNNSIIYVNNLNNGLYKINKDGTGKIRLGTDKIFSVYNAVYDGEIFYVNNSDSCLYKIKSDGTGRIKIADNGASMQIINIINGNIYYYTGHYNDENVSLYKIDINGSNLKEMAPDVQNCIINYYEDWFYYNSKDGIYRVNLDGTKKEKICDLNNASIIEISDGWLYASKPKGDSAVPIELYKIKIDGTIVTKILDSTDNAAACGNSIFYTITPDPNITSCILYKMDLNGQNAVKLAQYDTNSLPPSAFKNYNGKIYFRSINSTICSVDENGSNLQQLGTEMTSDFTIINDKIYYCTDTELFCMNLDGSKKVKLAFGTGYGSNYYGLAIGSKELFIDKDNIYYIYRGTDKGNYKEKFSLFKK